MKKLSFMLLTMVIAATFFIASCNKDVALDSQAVPAQANNVQMGIDEAKSFFNKNALYKQGRKDEDFYSPIIEFQPEPLWDLAVESSSSDYALVEVPLKSKKGGMGVTNWDDNRILNGKVSQLEVLNHFRLILLKDKSGNIEGKFMIASPNKEYAQSKLGYSEMLNCAFNRPPLDFDGGTLYFNLDGKYWKGYTYDKGKPIGEVTQAKKNTATSRDIYCSWRSVNFSYTITVGDGRNAVSIVHNDSYIAYVCVNTASFDYSPFVWNQLHPLPTIPLPTSIKSIIPAGQTICPNSFVFYSNSLPNAPSTQKAALFKQFNLDFKNSGGTTVSVPIPNAAFTFENNVTQQEASNFFRDQLKATQDAIDRGDIGADLTGNAQISAMRALFFKTYNDAAWVKPGFIGGLNYLLETGRSELYSKPNTCP
jgi:hypothetical protein